MPVAPTALALVAVINRPRDLEIARLLGWYRIPLRSAPKVVAVDWVAFYQTGAFGDERWQIRYVAPVRGHELARRVDLLRDEPDHPRAQEEYYKLQLGPIEALPRPIPADKWRRITFFYTLGEYLLSAESVNDLIVQTDERATLWQALRERAGNESPDLPALDLPSAGVDIALDPALLAALLGLSGAPPPRSGYHVGRKGEP